MATVLFVMKYPLDDAYSVKNKFNGQMDAVNDMGHEAYFVAYDRNYTYLIHRGEKKIIKKIWFGNWKHYIHTKAFFDLYDSVCRVLKTQKFDIVYMRYCPINPLTIKMSKLLQASDTKLVVEIPTYPVAGSDKKPPLLRRIYFRYSGSLWRKMYQYISLYTLIGEKADEYHGVPAINIDNGTNVEHHPVRQPKPEEKIHLLALASMSYWHGYDRLIRGIAALPKEEQEKVVLDMVGNEGDGSLQDWKNLAQELHVDASVVFHGRKTGAELEPFFDEADLGICSLGFCRINFTSGSILKLREYTSRGLPFVYAADDPAIDENLQFCMKVPNDESVIDVSAVIEFAKKMREQSEIREVMRAYAKEKMTWQSQFEKVFAKLDEIETVKEK